MRNITLEELEEIALAAKPGLYSDDEKDVTIAVEECGAACESAPVVVQENGSIFLGGGLGSCSEILIAADFDSEPTDEQKETVAAVIAVVGDAFGVELDEEHLALPESFPRDEIVERVDWLLECGLEG